MNFESVPIDSVHKTYILNSKRKKNDRFHYTILVVCRESGMTKEVDLITDCFEVGFDRLREKLAYGFSIKNISDTEPVQIKNAPPFKIHGC